MNYKSFFGGILGLIVLDVLVSTQAAHYLGSLENVPAWIAARLIDPTVPLIGSKKTISSTISTAQNPQSNAQNQLLK